MATPPLPSTTLLSPPDDAVDAAADERIVLRPGGALQTYHRQSRAVPRVIREARQMKEAKSPLCPPFRMVRHPISALLFQGNFGNVRSAMAQMLHASFEEVHHPFVDPSRPEGYTHLVDDEKRGAADAPVDNSKKQIEWRTNIYG